MESLLLKLKQQPVSHDQTVLALECNWDNLLHEIDDLLSQLDFVYFTYSVLTRDQVKVTSESQRSKWENGTDIVGSLPDNVIKTYYRDIAHHDPLWEELPKLETPLVVSTLPSGQSAFSDAFWAKQGVHSRAYIPMEGKNDKFWFHYFGLFHKLPAAEFERFFSKVSEWLIPMLQRYHLLLQVVSEKEQNPYKKQELLSATCLHILQMTSSGMPVKRIADKLALTEEGVTYHITRAKRVFGARNKTQLIAMMYEAGLL